ncbi:putative ABC transport system permease protein [Mesonia hippocampi]|uniref:Putative ABC transport system permease protein n=1 Tax=Mesonia hippocampi TaxID=1628250 RepID=A0A840ENY0_9FLAO|nr:ABC transporter permease [Mesonia hippocampi]MBB4118771.1 putative ABC transport system permease protein [Mesonia hippocampi]
MFDLDRWEEIFDTIRKNKLRTFLTGLSVASGIFIMVILLGFGQGMQNGIQKQFQRDAANRISIWPGVTAIEYKGLNPNRRIQFKNSDYTLAAQKYSDQLAYKSPLYRIWGGLVSYGKESGNYRVEGVLPDYQFLENAEMLDGRFINHLDFQDKRKVAVIGNKVKTDIFKDKEEVLGERIEISGINFIVVGVYTDPGGEREESRVFLPISTTQQVFSGGNNIDNLSFTLPQEENFEAALATSQSFIKNIEQQLKQKHTVAPEDESAINVSNSLEHAKQIYDLIFIIKTFFWWVGIATIFAGVVGVSNIMLIIVKERTKEIGIRKALGARPISIIGMVLQESIFVTAIAGFLGLITSMLLLELIGPYIQTDFIVNPTVNFNVALSTVIVLIVAGGIAGFFPARRAARIKPIVALRDE